MPSVEKGTPEIARLLGEALCFTQSNNNGSSLSWLLSAWHRGAVSPVDEAARQDMVFH